LTLINKLQFELHCPDEALALDLRHNFALTFQEQIVEAVERVCAQYAGEDTWLRINKLEIDLGRFSPHSFSTQFSAVFLQKFEQAFREQLAGITPAQRHQQQQLSAMEMLQHFLLKGTLPWWAEQSSTPPATVCAGLLQEQPQALRHFLDAHRFHPQLWRRIALQLDITLKAQVLALFPALEKASAQWREWQALLAAQMPLPPAGALPGQVITQVLAQAPALLKSGAGKAETWQAFIHSLPEIYTIPPEQVAHMQALLPQLAVGQGIAAAPAGNKTAQKPPALPVELLQTAYSEETAAEKHAVRQAGLVLLAAFFRPFFMKLELWDGVQWTSPAARHKAVHLLHYLCTGQQLVPEYSLVLEKILCGLPPEEAIPLEMPLTGTETAEAQELLLSVIAHWKMLKNTSVNGLRDTFLRRDGLLTRQQDGWRLQVEQKTLDVLLDSIPWGYSTISLPWNSYLVFVEW